MNISKFVKLPGNPYEGASLRGSQLAVQQERSESGSSDEHDNNVKLKEKKIEFLPQIKPDANNGGEVFYFDMEDEIIKAMIQNTLTEDQF